MFLHFENRLYSPGKKFWTIWKMFLSGSYAEKKQKFMIFATYNKPFFPFLNSLINEKSVYAFLKYS